MEIQAWLDKWLSLKVKQEEKEFNETTKEETKKNVRTLAFVQLGLKGKVVIENFPDLTQLNLGNNELEEVIIRNCPDLKLVSLAHNQLTKLKIENCPSVKEIYTHNNQLEKWDVPVEELKNLRTISYSDNPLTTEEKERLDKLGLKDTVVKSRVNGPAQDYLDAKYPLEKRAEVEKLDLSDLGLQGELKLEGFTNLKSLDCAYNELTNLDISDCGELKYLDASNNLIEEPDFLENSKLETIFLNHNKLSYFDNYTSLNDTLKELQLVANQLGDKVPSMPGFIGYLDTKSYKNLEFLNCSINKKLVRLDLTDNTKLKNLLCYSCDLIGLDVSPLVNLNYLYCQKNGIKELDCKKLKNLKELYCSNNLLNKLNVKGCKKLEILDCAENYLKLLDLSQTSLNFVSAKENLLDELNADCQELKYFDFSKQQGHFPKVHFGSSLTSLENLFFYQPSEEHNPGLRINLTKFPNLEKAVLRDFGGDISLIEIDVLAQRNTSKVIKILANPNNHTLENILELGKKELHGVSDELKEKLAGLAQKKHEEIRKKQEKELADELRKKLNLDDWGIPNQKKDEEENPSTPPLIENSPSEDSSPGLSTPQDIPTPKEPSQLPTKDQTILDLQEQINQLKAKIKELETNNDKDNSQKIEEIRKEILNSGLDESQKQKLLQLLDKIQNEVSSKNQPSNSTNYWPWFFGGYAVIVTGLLFVYFWRKRKIQQKRK